MTTKFKTLTLALGAAALLAPAATAHKPENKGPSAKSEHAHAHGKTGKMAVLRGVVTVLPNADDVVGIDVTSANKWGRYLLDDAVLVDVTDAKVKIADNVDADPEKTLADVQLGDRVHVLARVTKVQRDTNDTSLDAKRFHDKGQPEAEPTP